MKHNIYSSILLMALISLVSCNNNGSFNRTELAVPVSVQSVKNSTIKKYVNTTGTAMANYSIELSSEIAGNYQLQKNKRTNRLFKLGDKVKKGEVIIRLEDKEFENSIAINSKKLNLDINEQENKKQKSLFEKGGVTLREMRNAEVQLTNARYDYENAQLKLAKMTVVAPFDGVIVDLPYFTPNQKITAGKQLVKLMNYANMYMNVNLPEKEIVAVQVNQPAIVTNYTLPNDTLQGIVSQLSPAINMETRTFKGVMKIANPRLLLRPGMFVKADIEIAKAENVITIPKEIILTSRNKKRVFVVEKGVARMRTIKLGLENNEMVEVKSGLKLNEQLVIRGFETLRDGSKVKVVK